MNFRASDKKKNIAAQKAAAQRRLLQPRAGPNDSEVRKKSLQDRKKEELVGADISQLNRPIIAQV